MGAWVLAAAVFWLLGLFLLHCVCPKRLAMAAMWETIPGSSGIRLSSLC